ncbi:AAA family ATPase [Arthrobacter sp. SAFR-044]|uniref:AAA family ATPase n=1 Tax=Arthrobacter sp. SAFR-044 TaxID=3387278 RepID=UPI003F7C385B
MKADAGSALLAINVRTVPKAALAAWLSRDHEFAPGATMQDLTSWFEEEFPTKGTDLDLLYSSEVPAELQNVQPFSNEKPSADEIIDALQIDVEDARRHKRGGLSAAVVEELEDEGSMDDFLWTRNSVVEPLRDADVEGISKRALDILNARHVLLPDAENLVRRCVIALLGGHLVLQGPPGTGKTTLARALGEAFNVELFESTATSDWSPFHVIGGFRPNADGGLMPVYGKMTEAILRCADVVRAEVKSNEVAAPEEAQVPSDSSRKQATWLFIDEFNRADIDKAIGSLYTVLSSIDSGHLDRSPIDLWFEEDPRSQQLWVPARFRIIAAMNDLDTSYVNSLSQGLKRRFRFVTVGVVGLRGTTELPVSTELLAAFRNAYDWLSRTYGKTVSMENSEDTLAKVQPAMETLQQLVDTLRTSTEDGPGLPLGTAQVVDVMRMMLLAVVGGGKDAAGALDLAVADGVVPQMSNVYIGQGQQLNELMGQLKLPLSASALADLLLLGSA